MPKAIKIPELWDENTSTFITIQNGVLLIEHSLLSMHEWEKKWKKPFISEKPKTLEEWIDYVRCMTLNKDDITDDRIYENLPSTVMREINEYIEDPMTATTIYEMRPSKSRETLTAEVIYYSMIAYQIPFECAKWHLNTLIALIRVCGIKNNGEKMSRRENASFQRALNEKRLKAQK